MIYVVLGMHKSGTTLVSQILHHSGINMGGEEVEGKRSYDEGNKYERKSTKDVNHRILGTRGVLSLDIEPPDELPTDLSEERAAMRSIAAECSSLHKDWGFKDPRTYLTYPLWDQELPPHRVVVVIRRPEEMWRRYCPKRITRRPKRAYQLIARWCECYARILDVIEGAEVPPLVLGYGRLMSTQEEFQRLADFVERPLTDQRKPSLRRGRPVLVWRDRALLNLAKRLVRRRTGLDCDDLGARFDRLIEAQVAAS